MTTLQSGQSHNDGAPSEAFLAGGGELGELSRTFDWSRSSLGIPSAWPQSLRTVVRVMLTSRQPIWIGWGRDLTFFYNDPYKAIIGGKHPHALGRPTSDVWSEIWSDIGPMLEKAMGGAEGTYVEEQLLVMERNGYREETYYTFSYSPIPDDDGKPGGIICANTDDTKRVIGERQLSTLRDLASGIGDTRSWLEVCSRAVMALSKNARDIPFAMIYMANSDGKNISLVASCGILDGHSAAPRTVSISSNSPWPFADVLAGNDTHVVHDLDKKFADILPLGAWSEAPTNAAMLHITSAGNIGRTGVLIVGLNPFRLFDDNYRDFLALASGQIGAAIGNADAYEHERQRAEELAALDRSKTAFFSNLSHEFRTPLTLMLGPLEESLSNASALPASELDRVKIVHRNSLRLLKLVNSLLDFSRIEAGRVQATFQATDLSAYTAELTSNFRSATEKAGLRLVIDCPPLSESVYVDRDMWEKIVLNLLSNAFKFTFDGEIRVSLRQHNDVAELTVQDTGTGIPENEMPLLFERFHRVQGARGRSFEGSGIGLALVKELIDLHGGSIRAQSQLDHGATFVISVPLGSSHLPVAQVREGTTTPAAVKAQAFVEEALRWLPDATIDNAVDDATTFEMATDRPASDEHARVLIADDNADMRDYIYRLLSSHHRCERVADGEAALASIRAQRPDLLMTDIMMPKLDGFALIKAIRDDEQLRDLPIIVLSARAGEEASVEGLSAGADDYMVKPFSARELIARVDGALALARMRRTMGDALREEAKSLEILNRVGAVVAAELDLDRAVQTVTDAATELTGAAFGAFFYNVLNEKGESYMLYTLSGVPREAFSKFPLPRVTAVFGPTFRGEGPVRSDDILKDPRYGKNDTHFGMPKGHLPVRSYLAVPVISRSGEVLGGLFFGHPQSAVFTARDERLALGIAAHAAIAIDNARLYRAAQAEIATRTMTETALRKSEEEQVRLNQSLELKVVERTAQIAAANEQLRREAEEREKVEHALRQSQKMEAVGKLTGGVAHDFNNLLQVVGGNLQLLAKDIAGNDKAEQRVRNALAGVSRGSKLAAQLLAFGRRQPLAPKVVNLGRFMRGMDDLLRRALGDGVEVETVISGGLWNSLVDPSQVENALLNLAINARDAMNGHGKLTIEAGNAALSDDYAVRHAEVKPGQYVVLAVTDTGVGMTPHVVEHAFEPFFTTKPEGRGTGLGLSMVYGFVKQSNGHISIYSEPGHGTTIRIYLPRVAQAEDVTVEVDSGTIEGGNELVLVVEDDEDVRNTVIELLTDLGYRVLKAKDAQGALAIIESGAPIDLLFTDVVMPGPVRSPELARQARERLPNAAILFTSGYTDNAIVHGGRLDPGIELLSKPYRREALARKIRHVLRNRAQRSATHDATAKRSSRFANHGIPPLTILFVEDDDLVRLSTSELLTELGHTVMQAGSGAEALRLLDAANIDVLMTDVNLPDMRGSDIAAQAREQIPSATIIFATGSDAIPTTSSGAKISDAILLRKPFTVNALNDALRTANGRSHSK